MEDVEPPAPPPPTPTPPPPPQSNDNTRALIDPGTGEPIELYTGELITAESGGADQFVHLGRFSFIPRFGLSGLNRGKLSFSFRLSVNVGDSGNEMSR